MRVVSEHAAETVTIYAKAQGEDTFRKVRTVGVDENGAWSLRVKPTIATTYRARSKSAVSAPILIKVRPNVRLLVRRGVFTAEVKPLRPGASVWLQRWSESRQHWVSVMSVRLRASSSAAFRWKPAPGAYQVRLLLTRRQAGLGYMASFSPPRTDHSPP